MMILPKTVSQSKLKECVSKNTDPFIYSKSAIFLRFYKLSTDILHCKKMLGWFNLNMDVFKKCNLKI